MRRKSTWVKAIYPYTKPTLKLNKVDFKTPIAFYCRIAKRLLERRRIKKKIETGFWEYASSSSEVLKDNPVFTFRLYGNDLKTNANSASREY